MPVNYRRHLCDGEIRVTQGLLHIDEAVHRPSCHAHGCLGLLRVIDLRWAGAGWVEVRNKIVPKP